MPGWLLAFLEPLIRAIAQAVLREFLTLVYVKEEEAPNDKDRALGRAVYELVRRVPPAAPDREPGGGAPRSGAGDGRGVVPR